ncbi:hypothetical protein V1478_000269 [Vespula squamosa]|uniref:Uncharacterized protein n=1 Tax=Vespula squamosa TaxID=30214 RepID=A0ABD2C4Z9_VESSQ
MFRYILRHFTESSARYYSR